MDEHPLFEKPINDLIPDNSRPRKARTPDTPLPSLGRDTPADELLAIGSGQRALIRWVLTGLLYRVGAGALVVVLAPAFDPTVGVALLALTIGLALAIDIVTVVVFVRFASHLYPAAVTVVLVLCLLLLLGMLVVAVVNRRATGVLTRNGIRVGLLGARRADLDRLAPVSRDRRPNSGLPKLGW